MLQQFPRADWLLLCTLQQGFQVDIYVLWTRKLRSISKSTLPLNATTADTADILNRIEVKLNLYLYLYHKVLHCSWAQMICICRSEHLDVGEHHHLACRSRDGTCCPSLMTSRCCLSTPS